MHKGIQGYIMVYQGMGLFNGLQGYAGVYKVIPGYTGVCKGIQGYTRVYQGIQGYTMVYKGIQGLTRVYQGIQAYSVPLYTLVYPSIPCTPFYILVYISYSMVLHIIRADILQVRAMSKMSAGIICKTI